jgi:hypothetical protein
METRGKTGAIPDSKFDTQPGPATTCCTSWAVRLRQAWSILAQAPTVLRLVQVTASGAISYGGTLTVTDIGTDLLAAGDRFQLFSATPFSGSFASINLPPLGPGLDWDNKLLVDGSIEVIDRRQPVFASIKLSGTNVIFAGTNGTAGANYAVLTATNITLPLSNWLSIATNPFGAGGEFSFTNGIVPGERQRYFRLRTP